MYRFYDEITKKSKIEIYPLFSKVKEDFVLPNAYFINPWGYLYNSIGETGHEEANMIYTYDRIKDAFNGVKYNGISGPVSPDLNKYLRGAMKVYDRIMSTDNIDFWDAMIYIHKNCCNLDDILVKKLVLGIITSKIILLEKFIALENKVVDKKEVIDKIIELSKDDISEVLVKFCGFHKIETQVDKTITTTSLKIGDFKNYLDKNFKLCIVPGISLDGKIDEEERITTILKFLSKNPDYKDKVYIMSSR